MAFHPFETLEAMSQIQWSKPESLENVVLQLEQHPPESTIHRTSEDLGAWARGVMPPAEKDRLTSISLAGKPAPELDGIEWLNTDGKRASLADFRGKYVLLQFWTTWCGPCHEDIPSVRLVENLYRDKGLVVIGIHNNSMPIDAIKKDVIQNKLTYPIVVDRPDGRIIANYEKHGVSGYPSYVLIGPDGNVLCDDATTPGPTLRTFKTEIIRQFVLGKP
jgi:thiol-disulfide isomerase/thioredoxin